MKTSAITLEKKNHMAVITLSGSPDSYKQEISPPYCQLSDICNEIAWNEDIRVIVLAYHGEFLQSINSACNYAETESSSFVDSIAGLKQPVIAALSGDAVGSGLELALACDIRIGTEDASFSMPQIRDGRIPSIGGTQRLPRLVGRAKALEMILTGGRIHASEALRIGLINRIVPSGELLNTATAIADDMASRSPLALSYVKEALYSGMDLSLDQGMRMELDLYLLLFSTEDRMEGITAFREKRKPKFEGQ